ncbi:MAG: F0F1 ATP synthase subunit B [Hyphomicrobiaceae bacterium]|nr:F0F1 ATP synthase subunit B [Hyphomicrobiaceae bacterium]
MASKTTTGTEATGGQPNFPPFNTDTFAPQLVWLALTFGLLYFVLSRAVLPRIADVIDERANRIKRDLDAAERLKVETDKAISSYEDALGAAKAKANQIASETRSKLTADTDREKMSIESQLNTKLADAEQRIAAMKSKALASVGDIASSTATAIVGRLSESEPTADELKRALAPVAGE